MAAAPSLGAGPPGLPHSRPAASLPSPGPVTVFRFPSPSSLFPSFLSQSDRFCSHWVSLSLSLDPSPSFLVLISPSLCFWSSCCLPSPASLSFLPPSLDHSSGPCSPPLPGPLLAASLGPPSLHAPPPDVWLCWANPGGAFPWDLLSSCCQGRGQLAGPGGRRCPPGESPELLLAPPGWESTGGSDSGLNHLSTP